MTTDGVLGTRLCKWMDGLLIEQHMFISFNYRLLLEIWHSMISGPPIDEQNKAREKGWMDGPNEQQQPSIVLDEDDENFDPNDVPTEAVPIVEKKGGLYESDSDDYCDD